MNTSPGTSLSGGRYRLLERLAVGGMGEVWRAADDLLGRDVAIKILKDEYADDERFRLRFRAEARNTAGLSHPGIAQMYDYGEQEDLAYLVMELVPGQPLSEILARNERLSPEVTLEIMAQAARALHAAHEAGLIHRDIKPGNLIVDPDGQVKVTDFGIARVVNAATMTQTGTVLGTAQYVSPEQAEGRPLTASTDIYSLGIVAYECLSGRTPFTGESAVAIALAHVRDAPPPLPADVPQAVRDLVARCLDKETHGRPGSAEELSNIAYLTRESLRMGDGGADISAASASAVSVTDEGDGVDLLADMATPLQGEPTPGWEFDPASTDAEAAPGATLASADESSATSSFDDASAVGTTETSGVASADAAADGHLDDDAKSSRDLRRRRVLVMAGAMAVAVVCAGALMLGFRWEALFQPASYTGDKTGPRFTIEDSPSSSPGWNLDPAWQSGERTEQEDGQAETDSSDDRLVDADSGADRDDDDSSEDTRGPTEPEKNGPSGGDESTGPPSDPPTSEEPDSPPPDEEPTEEPTGGGEDDSSDEPSPSPTGDESGDPTPGDGGGETPQG